MARIVEQHRLNQTVADGSLVRFSSLPHRAFFRQGLASFVNFSITVTLAGKRGIVAEANAVGPTDGALHFFAADCLVSWDGEFHLSGDRTEART